MVNTGTVFAIARKVHNSSSSSESGGGALPYSIVSPDGDGDYLTVQAAIAADVRDMELRGDVVEDTTIIGDGIGEGDVSIHFAPGATLTFESNVRWVDVYPDQLSIYLNGGTITFAHTSGLPLIDFTGTGRVAFYGGGTITNNSTANLASIVKFSYSQLFFGHYTLNLPNYRYCGIYLSASQKYYYLDHIRLIGGGSACGEGVAVDSTGEGRIGTLHLDGSWSTSSSQPSIDLSPNSDGLEVDLIVGDQDTASYINIGCKVNMCRTVNSAFPNVKIEKYGSVHGGDLSAVWTSVNLSDDFASLYNVRMDWGDLVTSSIAYRCVIENCRGTGTTNDMSFGAPFSRVESNYSMGNLTLTTYADKTQVLNNQCGNVESTGGSDTITIDSGAVDLIVTGNYTDASIVDNGTGTLPATLTDLNKVY